MSCTEVMRSSWGKAGAPGMVPALSLRQPWAHAVVHGVRTKAGEVIRKDIENRSWYTEFRGDFLIHAAKGMSRAEYDGTIRWCSDVLAMGIADSVLAWPTFKELPRGGFVGVAELVGVIRPCRGALGDPFDVFRCGHRWHMMGQYGFRLANARGLPFVPWKGALGFFGVPRDVADQAMRGAA